ncbi:MAG: Transcriptional regulator [Pelotomaculum thermopropionicum]|uniref:Transcriptional regulator n=1 Tax=Pelotomaculum thermopropionicum TaxID=110500 RepID=A0A101HVX4_9FIRM|nr:MAG: Transcriptional regulator [Pelotomaculum thermopropionicum]
MEIHQLEYVLAVAKYQGFTRAAKEIKISQPSLSQQICKLENELGISLFVRTTRSVQLTPAGEEFVTHAKRIMSEVNAARRCIHEYVSIEKGCLKIGVIAVIGYSHIPNLLASFQKNFPGIKLNLYEEQCGVLLHLLRSSKIDAAICQIPSTDPNFHFYPLITDQMVVVTSHRHPLANRKSVDLKELEDENFILTPPTSGHYHDFLNSCRSAGFVPKVIADCAIVNTMLGLVREELGITVLSSHVAAAATNRNPGFKIISLTPTIKRETVLVMRNNADLPPPLKVFLKFTSQWLNKNKQIA